jgi:PAS domain S-box-containing protein
VNASAFDRVLRQVVIVPLFALLLLAGALSWLIHSTNVTVTSIEASDERITETATLLDLIINAETSLRGYQTTRDPSFLQPFHETERQLPTAFANRYKLATNDARRTAILSLQTDYNTWEQGFAEPLIATIAAGGQTNDIELNLQGQRLMDIVRSHTAALDRFTESRRNDYIRQYRLQMRALTGVLLLAATVLGLVLGLYLRRLLENVSAAFRQSHNALRIRAEESFRAEQKLRTTLQSIGDAVITCTADGRITSMNGVAEELTQWPENRGRNRPLDQVLRVLNETTRQPMENPVDKVKRLNATSGLGNGALLLRPDGSELFIDDSAAPIRDKAGQIAGVVLVFRDITLARKSRDALLANEKLAVAGRLAATIAHEIHNPLDSVANLLYLMDGVSTPEEQSRFLNLARQEITRVTQISRAMLSLYRESKAPVEIELKSTLESVLLLLSRRFSNLGVTVESNLPENLAVHGFPAELRQVFTNLLTNAAEAAGKGGVIQVTASHCEPATASGGLRREAGVLLEISPAEPLPTLLYDQG